MSFLLYMLLFGYYSPLTLPIPLPIVKIHNQTSRVLQTSLLICYFQDYVSLPTSHPIPLPGNDVFSNIAANFSFFFWQQLPGYFCIPLLPSQPPFVKPLLLCAHFLINPLCGMQPFLSMHVINSSLSYSSIDFALFFKPQHSSPLTTLCLCLPFLHLIPHPTIFLC